MMVVWEKLVNLVVVIVRLGCCLGLVCIYSAKGSYAADIFLQVESLGSWLLLWTARRYEGYECAVGEIGLEGWVDILICVL